MNAAHEAGPKVSFDGAIGIEVGKTSRLDLPMLGSPGIGASEGLIAPSRLTKA